MAFTKRLELSAIVHTYNEEKNIEECLDSLRWVDELIVVDMYSSDKTVEIARHYTDKIYFFENAGYADPARNFALSKAEKDWILVVDADERVTEELKKEIIEKVLTNIRPNQVIASKENPEITWLADMPCEFNAYYVPIVDYRFGRWVKNGPGSPQKQNQFRLLRRGKCYWPPEVHGHPQVEGLMSIMTAPMLHFSHLEISFFLNKLNKYTSFEAQERFKVGKSYGWSNTVLITLHQFYNVYIRQKAYKDGAHGFVTTVLMMFYTFIYRAKLWELHYKAQHPNSLNQHEPLATLEKINEVLKFKTE